MKDSTKFNEELAGSLEYIMNLTKDWKPGFYSWYCGFHDLEEFKSEFLRNYYTVKWHSGISQAEYMEIIVKNAKKDAERRKSQKKRKPRIVLEPEIIGPIYDDDSNPTYYIDGTEIKESQMN